MTTNGMRSLCSLNGNEWQADKIVILCHSALCKSAHAIKGASPNVIYCHKTKSFPLSAFRFPLFFIIFARNFDN